VLKLAISVSCLVSACGRVGFDEHPNGIQPDGIQPMPDARCVSGSIGFATPLLLTVGSQPNAVEVDDLDRDGALDLAAASAAGTSLFFGTGSRSFTPGQVTASAIGHNGFSVGDFDGDGYPDVVISGTQMFCVMINQRDRTLGSCTLYGTGHDANSLGIGPLDANSSLEIVIGNQIDDNIGVYVNSGTGTFTAIGVWGTGGTNPASEVIGNFDGDSYGDTVAANLLSDNIGIMHGSSTAVPGSPTNYATGSHPMALAAADLDGDGDLDVIAGSYGSVDVFMNHGDGTFDPRLPLATTAVLTSSSSTNRGVAIGDFDGDGDLDIACTNPTDDAVGVYADQGNGTFAPVVSFPAVPNPSGLTARDVDGDGLTDLVVTERDGPMLAVLFAQCL
jgi:hypothetical protein